MYKKLSHSVSDCLQQNEKLLGEEDLFCIAFQAKLGRWDSHTPGLYPRPRDFIPGYLRSAHGVFQTLQSNTVVLFNTATQRLQRFSSRGSPCLLWLYPWTSSLTHGTSSQFYTLRSWRLPDAPVKQQWSFSTQRRRGFRDSLLGVLHTSCGYIPGLLHPRFCRRR